MLTLKILNVNVLFPVDDAEVKAGNNPTKELLDSGFHDYQRL